MTTIDAVALTRDLLRFQTINPIVKEGEHECALRLGRLLEGAGFTVAYHSYGPDRTSLVARAVAAIAVVGSAWWAADLARRATDWNTWLSPVILGGGVVAALALVALWHRRTLMAVAASALAGSLLLVGPAAWSLQTAATAHQGSIVTAGPAVAGGRGGPGGGLPGGPGGGLPGGNFPGGPGGNVAAGPGGATTNGGTSTNGTSTNGTSTNGTGTGAQRTGRGPNGGGFGNGGPGGGAGGPGGLLNGTTPSTELTQALLADADAYTWVAATVGANNASGYQLATGRSVMPIGGFNGSDPSPTLAQFQALVSEGKIHYFISGGGIGPSNGGSSDSSSIAWWVQSNFTAVTVGGTTLYDLTQPTS